MRIFSFTCRELIEFLDRYLDGELPEKQRREFDWHLRLCRSCRAYLRTYRTTLTLEKKSESDEIPEDVPDDLVAAIIAARDK